MEEETDEVNKRYDITLIFWHILYAVAVVAVVAFGYLWLPAIVNCLQVVIDWFNWLCLVLSFLSLFLVIVSVLIFLIYVSFWKTTGKSKPKLYHQYPAAFPPEPPVVSTLSCDYIGLWESDDSRYKEIVPAFQAVREVEESNCTYDRVVAEVSSKSYRRTRSEKKMEKARTKVEYRRMESERVTTLQTMNGLSSEEIRMTVETFISEKNGVAPQLQNGVPQWQNGVAPQLQNGVPQWQNGVVDQWQNCLPQLQNRVVDQWQTDLLQLQNGVQWQGSRDDGTGRRRHRSRKHRLVGGSTGSGSYLAISN